MRSALSRLLFLWCAALLAIGAAPRAPANPLDSLQFLVGDWNCTFNMNGNKQTYKASFRYTLGKAWLREVDTWAGGGDESMLTYQVPQKRWRTVVTEHTGGVTLFEAKDEGAARIVFHSVYPDKSMTDTFERVSIRKYMWHFEQIQRGKATSSADVCVKS